MKTRLLLPLIATLFIATASADIIYPDGSVPQGTPPAAKKIVRGLSNIVFAPVEIPFAMYEVRDQDGITTSDQFGSFVITGPYKAAMRFAEGVHSIATAADPDAKPILRLEPENLGIWDAIPGYTHQFDWETIDTPANRWSPGF